VTDVINLQLEKFDVPDAIKRTVLATANQIRNNFGFNLDEKFMKELLEYAEQLEVRVQDEIDKTRPLEEVEQIDDFETVDFVHDEITLSKNGDGDIYAAVINGVIFGTLCNEPVVSTPDHQTFCCKQWSHSNPEHEDKEGNVRL